MRVLVLYWDEKDHPANEGFEHQFQEAMRSAAPGPIEFYSEFLESSRFPGESQSKLLHDYLRQKYAGFPIDVVVPNASAPLEFLFKYREDFLPDTPIVFGATNYPSAAQLESGAGATGIVFINSYRKTLDLALRLHPGTERVFIISGTPAHDKIYEAMAQSQLKGFNSKAAISYLTDLPLEELMMRIKNLPERSIVLYVWQQVRDNQGRLLGSQDILKLIAPLARVPLYGMSFANVGLGIVGGYVWTMEANTARLAEITLKVASGTRASNIPVEGAPDTPMFDWHQLQRWGIREDSLPEYSVIRFREVSLWQQYKWRIIAAITAIVLQSLLIGALLLQRRRARQYAAALVKAQKVLRESEERFRLAIKATNDAVWDIDLVTGTVSWNETYAMLYGRPPETSNSWQWWIDRIHPEDRERTNDGLRSAISGGKSTWTCEYRFRRVDDTWAYLYDRAYIARDPSGSAWRVIGAMQDLTQRKRVEAELRESEERFRNIADSAPVIVWVCDPDGAVSFTNRFGLNFFGVTMEQNQGVGWSDLLHPDDSGRVTSEFSAATASRRIYQISFRVRRADGEYRWVLAQGAPRYAGEVYVGHIGIATDITELKQSQEQLQSAQKLESLGVLAGGIAHDFNNLLGGIYSVAELVEMELAEGAAPMEEIQRIKTAATRGAEIVRELMVYAGENPKDLNEAVDVPRLVEEMLKLLKVSISKQVSLRMDFGGDLPTVWGNASQIRQVVMNLVLNASEAIGDAKGVITVTAAQVSGGRDLAPNNAMDLTAGDYVRIEVSDTGCGMTEETKAKIFDPFFSTKFAGRGLGLAVVQGIVRALGGTINIVSAPGQGTVFQVLLPCAPKGASEIHNTITSDGLEKSNANARTILLVEDDQMLRRAVSMGLQKRGFSVIEASDGSVALDLIHEHKDEIDVVLLDVTLPGASSREVLEEALRIRPGLKVIVTSAYDKETVAAYYSGLRVNHFIRKPFHLDDLVRLSGAALSART